MRATDGRPRFMAGRARRAWLAVVTAMMLAFGLMSTAAPAGADDADHPKKVTICHAAGLEGTTHYITLTIGYQAVYGPAGHFYENGTTRAGHEQDYLGECREDEPETNSASLTIVKQVASTDPRAPEASFPFVLSASGDTESFALANGDSARFGFTFDSDRFDVVVGELTGELDVGFSFESASCISGDRVIPQGSRASVSLLDGADVTCTFVNRYEEAPEDEPSVTVIKDVTGDRSSVTEFDFTIQVGERTGNFTLEDDESQTFYPAAGSTVTITEIEDLNSNWTTSISCESDEGEGPFGARGSSIVIDDLGEGEDIVCTVLNTYDDGEGGQPTTSNPTTQVEATELVTCFDGTAEDETGACVKPEAPEPTVLGIQIEPTTTTVDAVTTGTLPFTGDDTNGLVVWGLLVLVAGALILGGSVLEPALVRSGRHEASPKPIRRWMNGREPR